MTPWLVIEKIRTSNEGDMVSNRSDTDLGDTMSDCEFLIRMRVMFMVNGRRLTQFSQDFNTFFQKTSMSRCGKTMVLTELNVYEPMRENDGIDNVEGFEDNPQPCLMLLTHCIEHTFNTKE